MSNDIAPAIVSAEDHELIERMAERMSSGTALHTARVRAELTSIYAAGYAAGIGYYFAEVTTDPAEAAAEVPDELAPVGPERTIFTHCNWIGGCDKPLDHDAGELLCTEHTQAPLADAMAYHLTTDPEPTPASGTSRSDIAELPVGSPIRTVMDAFGVTQADIDAARARKS